MYCNQCGNQVSDNASFCPICGNRLGNSMKKGNISMNRKVSYGEGASTKSMGNLFQRFSMNPDMAIKKELAVWGAICVSVVLALLTCILVGDVSGYSFWVGGVRSFELFLMFAGIAVCIIMALRKQIASVLIGNILIPTILLIPFYKTERALAVYGTEGNDLTILTVLFVFAIIAAIGIVLLCVLQFFTAMYVERFIVYISIGTLILILCMTLVPILLADDAGTYIEFFGAMHFIMGTVSYLIAVIAMTIYTCLYFNNMMEHQDFKSIYKHMQNQTSAGRGSIASMETPLGVQFVQGVLMGKTYPVQGEIIIGSQQGSAHIIVPDSKISRQHCVIRYNAMTHKYEVMDMSTNGVYLNNGMALSKGVYNSINRGTILWLGSAAQQIRLM